MNRPFAVALAVLALASSVSLAACSDDAEGTSTPVTLPDAAGAETAADDSGGGGDGSCTAARETALQPVDQVSTATVTVIAEEGSTKTLFVDASAGGAQQAPSAPRVYLDLAAASRVDVSDVGAASSTAWDLALERSYLFTNSGDGGPGDGGAAFLAGRGEDAVTSADAGALVKERFFDEACNPIPDRSGRGIKTTFDDWYDYDQATNRLTPMDGTYLVRGGTGKLFKLRILSYYAAPDGGTGEASGRFTLRVTPIDG